ncbi:hypothetical protein LCGC14_2582550 [marine sediment metagenome]|uniref:Uncharacterized protein n=1 Tax=marine sediment metagenome TaxID=412755 RepID=A0A0F9D6T0_9ZZZZ
MNVIYITNGVTQDGFGARMHRAINTIAFTYYVRDNFNVNVEYIHTPFQYEGFGEKFDLSEKGRKFACNHPYGNPYDEVTREGYLKRAFLWDEHMNYIGKTINNIDINRLQVIDVMGFGKNRLFNDISKGSINNKLYIIKYLQKEFNSGHFDINIVDKYYSEIKEKFMFEIDEDNNNIILQIRRKDAIYFGNVRYIEDEYYLDILKELESYKTQYNISVRTQRSNFDFTKYSEWNIIYDDEEEDYDFLIRKSSLDKPAVKNFISLLKSRKFAVS